MLDMNTLEMFCYSDLGADYMESWTGPARLTGLKNVTKIFLGPQNEF
jgi:hypothetical protein